MNISARTKMPLTTERNLCEINGNLNIEYNTRWVEENCYGQLVFEKIYQPRATSCCLLLNNLDERAVCSMSLAVPARNCAHTQNK
jgi:hypothetical protein